MTREQLFENIKRKQSFLCVGLDTDLKKVPQHLIERAAKEEGFDPIFEFNKAITDATAPYCIAYKPNLAFYEAHGVKGWIAFEQTVKYIRENYPDQFIIADAKRGDIGNTSKLYARTFFEEMDVDAVTVAPYMGEDSVTPFLGYEGKWVILLALTSNKGSEDFQKIEAHPQPLPKGGEPGVGERLFERVIRRSQEWERTFYETQNRESQPKDTNGNEFPSLGEGLGVGQPSLGEGLGVGRFGVGRSMMYVVGATQGSAFADIRRLAPDHFLLVPGIGAQGGSLEEVCKYGWNDHCGLIVNSSRAIIYADSTEHFAEVAAEKAHEVQQQMAAQLALHGC